MSKPTERKRLLPVLLVLLAIDYAIDVQQHLHLAFHSGKTGNEIRHLDLLMERIQI